MAITERESQQLDQANGSGRTPVVFIHGLWLLPNSRDRRVALFADAGIDFSRYETRLTMLAERGGACHFPSGPHRPAAHIVRLGMLSDNEAVGPLALARRHRLTDERSICR